MPSPPRPPARTRFLALLVVSEDAATGAATAARLGPLVGGDVSVVSSADVSGSVRVPGGTGVLVYVPAAADDLDGRVGALIDTCRAADPGLPVLLRADGLSGPAIAAALRRGAADAIFLEAEPAASAERLRDLLRRRSARAQGQLFEEGAGLPRMLGGAPSMREMARLVERVAAAEATVLILGESGTGKELVAQALHALSPRRKGPFVAINCAAIPETLLENELFGHEKGSYTGASSLQIGKVEAAEKGTLFLDEIGEMPLPLQSKILRLLQEKTYDRIGGTKTRKADVRIIAATNRDLKDDAARKRFREDLYYRLSVVPIPLPALRERPEDIPVIAHAILERLARELGRPALHFSAEALQRLVSYRWPGNVRELENEIERAVVLAGKDEIGPLDLELKSRVDDPDKAALARLAPLHGTLEDTLQAAVRMATRIRVAHALEESRGDRQVAADMLGISRDELEEIVERRSSGKSAI